MSTVIDHVSDRPYIRSILIIKDPSLDQEMIDHITDDQISDMQCTENFGYSDTINSDNLSHSCRRCGLRVGEEELLRQLWPSIPMRRAVSVGQSQKPLCDAISRRERKQLLHRERRGDPSWQ